MDSAIQQLKARNPLTEVASRHVKLRRSGKYLVGRCPFHPDRTPSFVIDIKSERWRCFGRCATRWLDVIDFMGWLRYGASWNTRNAAMFKGALRELQGDGQSLASAGALANSASTSPPSQRAGKVPRHPAPNMAGGRRSFGHHELSHDAQMLLDRVAAIYRARLWTMGAAPGTPLAYLHQRGFADGTIRQGRLGYCAGDEILKYLRQSRIPLELARGTCLIDPERGDCEFLRGRIVFPDFGSDGHVLALAGRKWAKALGPRSTKYLVLKGWDKPLYGWTRLDKGACGQPVFVSESLPDGLTLSQWGLDALITLGTALKAPHARLLAALPRPLVYVPHNDGGTGLAAAQTWRMEVGRGEILKLPSQVKDINELALIPQGQHAFVTACAELLGIAPPGT